MRFCLIAKFAYNNRKMVNLNHTSFKLNHGYYTYVSGKKNIELQFLSKFGKELATKLRNNITVYTKNLQLV